MSCSRKFASDEKNANRQAKEAVPSLKVNALSNTTCLIFNVFIGFYTTRLTIGYLDEMRFGMWMLTSSVVGYFGLLQMGVGTGVLRYAPMYRGKKDISSVSAVINTAMSFYSVLGLVILAVSMSLAGTIANFFGGGPQLAALIRVVGLAAAIECPTWVVDATIRSFEKFVLANALVNLKALMRAASIIFCISMQYDVIALGWSLVIINLVMLFASLAAQCVVCKEVSLGVKNVSYSMLRLLMSYGAVIMVTSVADTLTFGSSKIILGRVVSLEAVGIFAVIALLINYYRRAIYAVTKVFMPRFSYLQGADDYVQIRSLYLRGSKFATIFAGASALLLWTIGPAFVRLWLAKDYSIATPALMVLTAGTLVLASNRMAVDLMYGLGKQTMLAWMGVVEGVAVLACSAALAYRYGLVGVAIGVALPIAIIRGLVQAWYVCRLIGMKFRSFYGERILLLWVMAGGMSLAYWKFGIDRYAHGWIKFLAISTGVTTIYMALTYFFALNKQDRREIKSHAAGIVPAFKSRLKAMLKKTGTSLMQVMKLVRRNVLGLLCIGSNIAKIGVLVRNSDLAKTYYPESVRKSRTRIYFENLAWLLRHKEVNDFYFVYGFDRKHGVDHNAYMDYNSFSRLRNKTNASARCAFRSVDYRCLLSDKFAFGQYLSSLNFATPEILALCRQSSVLWCHNNKLEGIESLLAQGKMDCFLKDLTGQCAQGVYTFKVDSAKVQLGGSDITLPELNKKLAGMWILQQRISQHSLMSLLYPNSVNTIRLVTIYNQRPQPFSALIRIGANGNYCDNWAIGGLLGSVDLSTGKISKYCLFKPGYGTRVDRHPETGIIFDNFTVPFFQAAVEKALLLHQYFYGIRSIGWDIAITPEGPIFIEGNDNWELSMHQALEGGLKAKFLAAMG